MSTKKSSQKQNKPAQQVAPVTEAKAAEPVFDYSDRMITKTYKSGLSTTTGRRVFGDKSKEPVELPKTIRRNKLAAKGANDPLMEKVTEYTYFYTDGSKTIERKVQRVNDQNEYDLVEHTVTTIK